jgi:hypothetical protein
MFTKVTFTTMLGICLFIGHARAERPETAVTLSCVPVAVAAPATVGNCLLSRHAELEVAQCLGIVKGGCYSKRNEIRKAGRAFDKEVTQKLRKAVGLK